jgi:hypothetical protein
MKKLLLLFAFTLFLSSCGASQYQSKEVSTVVDIRNQDQKEIYVKANNWMVSIFTDAESIIQFTDKESGTITGKYRIGNLTMAQRGVLPTYVFAILNIQCKDGKAKLKIIPDSFAYPTMYPYYRYSEEKLNIDIDILFKSFENYMPAQSDDDW